MRTRFAILWIFATLNYLYCDVVTLMDASRLRGFLIGSVGGLDVTQGFLLAAAALVEIPMAMVLLSNYLPERGSHWANLSAGLLMTAVQLLTLVAKTPTPYYAFFSLIEIATTSVIVFLAWRSVRPFRAPSLPPRAARPGRA